MVEAKMTAEKQYWGSGDGGKDGWNAGCDGS